VRLVGFIIRSVYVGIYSSIVFITLTHLGCLASRDICIFALFNFKYFLK